MRSLSTWVVLGACVAVGCGSPGGGTADGVDDPGARPMVIDGSESPDSLGFSINRFERNAVLGQVAVVSGKTYQGCSGTLIGDRLVVTAGHCVVANQDAWLSSGASPQIVPASYLRYAAGDDVNAPLWLAKAESVHLHPDIQVLAAEQRIIHDAALVVLADSAWESTTNVVPIRPNREPLEDSLIGQQLLQGGFGSLDGTYDFSPKRYWSLVEASQIDAHHLTVKNIDKGFPTYGDSGSGVLYRGSDGVLRNLGMASSGVGSEMRFSRLDDQGVLLDAVVTPSLLCGPVSEAGACRDDVLVTCDADGFRSVDCREESQTCEVGADGTAGCSCTCDADQTCDPTCACDADCPCTCDVTAACDTGCTCDAACNAAPASDGSGEQDDSGCATKPEHRGGGSLPSWLVLSLLGLAGLGTRRRSLRRPSRSRGRR